MKLSDAIEVGGGSHKQCKGMFVFGKDGEVIEACALGRAIMKLNPGIKAGANDKETYGLLERTWPKLKERIKSPRAKSFHDVSLMSTIYGLNDSYGWDIKRIVEWLRKEGL